MQPITNDLCKKYGLGILPAEYSREKSNVSRDEWNHDKSYNHYILDGAWYGLSVAEDEKRIKIIKTIYDIERSKDFRRADIADILECSIAKATYIMSDMKKARIIEKVSKCYIGGGLSFFSQLYLYEIRQTKYMVCRSRPVCCTGHA